MKFKYIRTSSSWNTKEVELNSLKELLKWVDNAGDEVIIREISKNVWQLEIYDDYRE